MVTWALQFDGSDFLHSLCKWIVAQAASFTPTVTLQYAGTPRSLWRDKVIETDATDPYSVIRTYPGAPLSWAFRLPRQSLQVQTTGTSDEAAKAQIGNIFQAFTDADGLPLRGVVMNGFKASGNGTTADGTYGIVFANLMQRPGMTSRDDRGRATFTFNVEVGFRKLS